MADAKTKARAAEKEAKAAKRAQRKQTRQQLWQAFQLQRKQDKALIPIMLACLLGVALVFFLLGLLWGGQWFMLILGLMFGALLAFWMFTRRLEASMYDKVSDQPGAGGWALENMRNGVGMVWHTKTAVAANREMDVVHRVVGNPGIILVGEGNAQRLKPLMNQQKKRLQRVAGQHPIYEILVGDGEGRVPVKKLQREVMKLPRNLSKDEVGTLAARVDSIDTAGPGLPKGPMPAGAKAMSGMNRRARRAQQRGK
ncbi:DUF4191 domain-containing protein [Corynebacterium sp. 13CS0277]|uniref:DUF4191 domain-containing protein n=1 Tax=Corynebacterium sp. 13CS0277 TaxID=2071994 RepID=UPI000D03CD6C|nr:DUF4191 domain-containing protein [Corynebacterium sp. 13CS0277]PRQ11115.1 DUF4191 domain-containing protein [Corynebacterium sp. 13CS0277]